jgi:hypothetical protein
VTNTTTEFWSLTDPTGTDRSLQDYAWNIQKWGGARDSVPPVRGADVVIPYRPGQLHMDKLPDSQVISLGMTVQGSNSAGARNTTRGPRGQFRDNWRALRNLLWQQQTQYTLTKRWLDSTGTLQTASAKCEFAGGLGLTTVSEYNGTFSVDLLLADPFFYGAQQTIAFDSSLGTTGSNPATAVTTYTGPILGDYFAQRVTIAATPKSATDVTNPRIDNIATNPDSWWLLGKTVLGASSLTIDLVEQSAVDGTAEAARYVQHFGYPEWLRIQPAASGASNLKFSARAGNWVGTLGYYPAYL